MSTVQEIEKAVQHLSRQDLERFRKWFEEYEAQVWDNQIEQDAKSGKLDKLADKAIADFHAGKFQER
jgi:hypothetical protein